MLCICICIYIYIYIYQDFPRWKKAQNRNAGEQQKIAWWRESGGGDKLFGLPVRDVSQVVTKVATKQTMHTLSVVSSSRWIHSSSQSMYGFAIIVINITWVAVISVVGSGNSSGRIII